MKKFGTQSNKTPNKAMIKPRGASKAPSLSGKPLQEWMPQSPNPINNSPDIVIKIETISIDYNPHIEEL